MPELSKKGARIQILMSWAIREGYKKTQFYNMIKGTPVGYRKKDVLRDWDILVGRIRTEETLKYVGKDKRIGEQLYEETRIAQPKKLSTLTRVGFWDERTGKTHHIQVWIDHTIELTPRQLKDKVIDYLRSVGTDTALEYAAMPVVSYYAVRGRRMVI